MGSGPRKKYRKRSGKDVNAVLTYEILKIIDKIF